MLVAPTRYRCVSFAKSSAPQVRAQAARFVAVRLIGAVAPAERAEAGITALPAIAVARLGRGNRSAENQSRCAGDNRRSDPASAVPAAATAPATAVVTSASPGATTTPTATTKAAPAPDSAATKAATAAGSATTEAAAATEASATAHSASGAAAPLGQFDGTLGERLTARTKGPYRRDVDHVRFIRNGRWCGCDRRCGRCAADNAEPDGQRGSLPCQRMQNVTPFSYIADTAMRLPANGPPEKGTTGRAICSELRRSAGQARPRR